MMLTNIVTVGFFIVTLALFIVGFKYLKLKDYMEDEVKSKSREDLMKFKQEMREYLDEVLTLHDEAKM